MNFQFYAEKLKNSEIYDKFIKENKKAFPCSCFFIIDKQGKDNKQHFDFFIPDENKMMSIQLENGALSPVKIPDNFKPEQISLEHDFDFDTIETIIQKEMDNKKINNRIQKLLFSLQHKNKRDFLVGTVFISNFGLIKVNIDIQEKKIIFFEKKSFLDMFKIIRKGGKNNGN